MLKALQQLNWLDIVVIILLIRIIYIAVEKGLLTEVFKILGVITSIILACHYYTVLGEFVSGKVPLSRELANLFSFLLLNVFGCLLFVAFRNIFMQLIKKEPASVLLSKWIGGALGVLRGFLTVGLLILILQLSTVDYLSTSVKESFLASRFSGVASGTYKNIWDGFVSKINPETESNPAVFQVSK